MTVSEKASRPRREPGSGSLYQRADGIWIGSIEAGWTKEGTRRRIIVSSKQRGIAARKLREAINRLETEGTPTVSARVTVKQYAEEWIKLREHTVRPGAYNTDASTLKNWIIPTIGGKRFTNLTPGDIRAVATAQRDAGRSEATRRRTHSTLMQLLKAAKLDGHSVNERLLLVEPPGMGESDRDAMTIDDALAAVPWMGELHHGSRFLAGLVEGLRQAEALGLTWDNVDLNLGTITIAWQLKPLPYKIKRDRTSGFRIPDNYRVKQLHGALHLVRPKTRKGFRVIPLIEEMRLALLAWREVQKELIPHNPHNLVWPNLDGTPTTSKTDDEEWYGIQQAAGIHHPDGRLFTIHELRHTTATFLLEAGVDPAIIIAILGHASILTTRGYQHVRTERAREALEKVGTMLGLGGPS